MADISSPAEPVSEYDADTRRIIAVLVNALMETRDAGATNSQVLEAALSVWVTMVMTLREEEYTISVMPQIQEQIYHKWQRRMAEEGVGQVRH